jgi:hypothetical protein
VVDDGEGGATKGETEGNSTERNIESIARGFELIQEVDAAVPLLVPFLKASASFLMGRK